MKFLEHIVNLEIYTLLSFQYDLSKKVAVDPNLLIRPISLIKSATRHIYYFKHRQSFPAISRRRFSYERIIKKNILHGAGGKNLSNYLVELTYPEDYIT